MPGRRKVKVNPRNAVEFWNIHTSTEVFIFHLHFSYKQLSQRTFDTGKWILKQWWWGLRPHVRQRESAKSQKMQIHRNQYENTKRWINWKNKKASKKITKIKKWPWKEWILILCPDVGGWQALCLRLPGLLVVCTDKHQPITHQQLFGRRLNAFSLKR